MAKTVERILTFVRDGSRGTETIAVVRCKVHPVQKDATTTVEALKEVLTHWLADTKEGKAAWKQSSQDFNIGDLALHEDTFLKSHSKMLETFGIYEFKIICIVDHAECIPFDTVLAHAEDLI